MTCDSSQKIFCRLADPGSVDDLIAARPEFIEGDRPVHHVVSVDPFDELSMRLPVVSQEHVGMRSRKELSELRMIFSRYLGDLVRILFHLSPAR